MARRSCNCTQTATLIAVYTPHGPGSDEEHQLYRSRHGEFFFVYNYLTPFNVMKAEVVLTTHDEARGWTEKYANEAAERWFGTMPEAGEEERRPEAGGKERRFTFRIPAPLADAAERIAARR